MNDTAKDADGPEWANLPRPPTHSGLSALRFNILSYAGAAAAKDLDPLDQRVLQAVEAAPGDYRVFGRIIQPEVLSRTRGVITLCHHVHPASCSHSSSSYLGTFRWGSCSPYDKRQPHHLMPYGKYRPARLADVPRGFDALQLRPQQFWRHAVTNARRWPQQTHELDFVNTLRRVPREFAARAANRVVMLAALRQATERQLPGVGGWLVEGRTVMAIHNDLFRFAAANREACGLAEETPETTEPLQPGPLPRPAREDTSLSVSPTSSAVRGAAEDRPDEPASPPTALMGPTVARQVPEQAAAGTDLGPAATFARKRPPHQSPLASPPQPPAPAAAPEADVPAPPVKIGSGAHRDKAAAAGSKRRERGEGGSDHLRAADKEQRHEAPGDSSDDDVFLPPAPAPKRPRFGHSTGRLRGLAWTPPRPGQQFMFLSALITPPSLPHQLPLPHAAAGNSSLHAGPHNGRGLSPPAVTPLSAAAMPARTVRLPALAGGPSPSRRVAVPPGRLLPLQSGQARGDTAATSALATDEGTPAAAAAPVWSPAAPSPAVALPSPQPVSGGSSDSSAQRAGPPRDASEEGATAAAAAAARGRIVPEDELWTLLQGVRTQLQAALRLVKDRRGSLDEERELAEREREREHAQGLVLELEAAERAHAKALAAAERKAKEERRELEGRLAEAERKAEEQQRALEQQWEQRLAAALEAAAERERKLEERLAAVERFLEEERSQVKDLKAERARAEAQWEAERRTAEERAAEVERAHEAEVQAARAVGRQRELLAAQLREQLNRIRAAAFGDPQ